MQCLASLASLVAVEQPAMHLLCEGGDWERLHLTEDALRIIFGGYVWLYHILTRLCHLRSRAMHLQHLIQPPLTNVGPWSVFEAYACKLYHMLKPNATMLAMSLLSAFALTSVV